MGGLTATASQRVSVLHIEEAIEVTVEHAVRDMGGNVVTGKLSATHVTRRAVCLTHAMLWCVRLDGAPQRGTRGGGGGRDPRSGANTASAGGR